MILNYVVAAEVDGPGFEGDGQIGIWLVEDIGPDPGGALLYGNEIAKQVTEWGAEMSPGSPVDNKRVDALAAGGSEAEACA